MVMMGVRDYCDARGLPSCVSLGDGRLARHDLAVTSV